MPDRMAGEVRGIIVLLGYIGDHVIYVWLRNPIYDMYT